jgi:Zn-dependent peptidase ImmA (M78 family)
MSLQKSAMENMAEDFRKKLSLKEKDPFDPFKLEIEDIEIIPISEVTDFDEKHLNLLMDDWANQWSAMSVPLDASQEKWVVVYNDVHDKERQRVSVLEEVWHILLGHRLTKIVKIGTQHSRTFDSDEEHDAYYLASASLIPEKAVVQFVEKKGDVAKFASSLGVSKELVEYRIKRLGLWYSYKERRISISGKPS